MNKGIQILLFFFICVVNAQVKNQNEILQSYASGKYQVYKVEKLGHKKFKFIAVKKQWPITFSKTGQETTEVLVKRSGILDEQFKPDVPGYPAYFAFSTYRLSFIDQLGIYYSWNGKEEATTKYVFVKDGASLKESFAEINNKVAVYARAVFKNQTGARVQVKEKKAALAEADRKANSLEGKQVKNIRIELQSKPQKVAHFSEAIHYGVVATLVDGTVLKTPNLGGKLPWSDFKLAHKGCSNTTAEIRVDEDAKSLQNDCVELSVKAIYHSGLQAKKTIPTTNNISIRVNQGGFWGHDRHKHMTVFQGSDGQHAGRGDNLTIKVKTVSHKQSGKKINKIEIYNTTENKVVARYKLTPDTELIVNAGGGRGMNGFDGTSSSPNGGNGGNGGAGGMVTIIKDPSVKAFAITVNNEGGNGGNGGKPYYSTASRGSKGRTGDNGTTQTQTKSITLNF